MELTEYVLNRLFPTYMPEDPGSVDEGLFNLVALTMHVDGKVTVAEVGRALAVLKQLHTYKGYDDGELGEKLGVMLQHVQERGLEATARLACEQVSDPKAREVAFKLVAFMNGADGRVVPIESALEDWVAGLFGIDAERQRALLAELDAEIEAGKQVVEASAAQAAEPLTALNCALLDNRGLPRFDEVDPAQIEPAVAQLIAEVRVSLAELEQSAGPTWEGFVEPLERLHSRLEFTWGLVHHLLSVMNSPALREAYQRVQPSLVELSIQLGQSEALFEVARALRDEMGSTLDEGQLRVVTALVRDMERAGIGLKGAERARFNAIQMELAELGTRFSNNLLDATRAWSLELTERAQIEGLPESLLQQAAQAARDAGDAAATVEEGPWRITLDGPSMLPFLKYSPHRALREQVYMAYMTRASSGEVDNTPLLTRILELRQEQSRLLGFEHFAAQSLSAKMAGSVEAVDALLEQLRGVSLEAARADHAELEAFAAESGAAEAGELKQWDIAHWSEKLREARYGFNEEALRPYFVFEQVLEGLFELIEGLFGVKIKAADGMTAVWHKDVRYFHVEEDGQLIATFFLDPYSRPGQKRGGAWHGDACGRSKVMAPAGEHVRLPTSYLVCNQTPPVGGKPSLMSFGEVSTLFHEFGHGLQHMLTRVDYGMVAGISGIEWDAVELPSQFMENWLTQPAVLKRLGRHVETGEPLPDALIGQLLASQTFRAGSDMLRQVYLASLDLTLHARFEPGTDPFAVQAEIAKRTSVLAPLPADRFLCGFSHIFAGGYAAGYFSYKWAEVLSADAFGAFEDAGLDDEAARVATGRRFRETVLALGGSKHPMEVFRAFRGREPSTEALLRHSGLLKAA
jgi:oligopeptidase A